MKALQKFTPEYLEHCRSMTPDQIAKFLDEFRLIHGEKPVNGGSKLISIKVPKNLLSTFRTQCQLCGVPYQTQIKKLMTEWLNL